VGERLEVGHRVWHEVFRLADQTTVGDRVEQLHQKNPALELAHGHRVVRQKLQI
jgi:hypothetical protein